MVEPIRLPTAEEREAILERAGLNLFWVAAADIVIDLLTDSGTGAMSAAQWAAMMRGDESYAGADSFGRLREAVGEVTGFDEPLPTHQGRASERVLFEVTGGAGRVVPNNAHFDTTRANIERTGARAVDLSIPEAAESDEPVPLQGQHGRGRARGAARGRRGAGARWSSAPSPATRRAASPSAWRTCGQRGTSAGGAACGSSSTPAASPRTRGSSGSASRASAAGPSAPSPASSSTPPTARSSAPRRTASSTSAASCWSATTTCGAAPARCSSPPRAT